MSEFGGVLRRIREEKGLTAYKLSKLTGIPTSAISVLESGKRRPTKEIMIKLSREISGQHIELLEMARAVDLLDDEGINVSPAVVFSSHSPAPGKPASLVIDAESGFFRKELPVYPDVSCGWGSKTDSPPNVTVFPTPMIMNADHAVTVTGDSMIDVGFRPGTYLFIKSQPTASSGQPVIARIDGTDYTCKIFRDNGRKRWLEGRSASFKDRLYFDQMEIDICGVVVAYWGRT